MKRKHEESKIQVSIVRYFRQHFEGRIASIPNGGWRDPLEAIRLKEEGVEAGHPDLVIYGLGGRIFLIEVKEPSLRNRKNGGLSDSQMKFIPDLRRLGFIVCVVYSLEDAIRLFESWELAPKELRIRTEKEKQTWL